MLVVEDRDDDTRILKAAFSEAKVNVRVRSVKIRAEAIA
jgi:hypothetical protein